jgi:hypothetical protein
MTVAVVNHAPYHLEIVAGWLHVLSQLPTEVIWYQAGQASPDGSYPPQRLLDIQVRWCRGCFPGVRACDSACCMARMRFCMTRLSPMVHVSMCARAVARRLPSRQSAPSPAPAPFPDRALAR